jgi:XTP/dITP diphosphohydrolase
VSGRPLLVATRSRHKLEELRALLDLPGVRLVSPDDVGIEGEPVEDGRTFRANALIKARFYADRSGLPTLADDSGLEVDALGGAPGVRTRRYAGEDATDEQNNARLLAELAGLPPERRGARYRCVLALLDPAAPDDRMTVRTGTFRGRVAQAPRGTGGFGYDPIFEPATEPPGGRTVGQMSAAEKQRVSHRGRAARSIARALRERGWGASRTDMEM